MKQYINFLHCFISYNYLHSDATHTGVLAAKLGEQKRNFEIKFGILRVDNDICPLIYLQIRRVLKTMRLSAFMLLVLACQ
jgi:hypothetical protein